MVQAGAGLREQRQTALISTSKVEGFSLKPGGMAGHAGRVGFRRDAVDDVD